MNKPLQPLVLKGKNASNSQIFNAILSKNRCFFGRSIASLTMYPALRIFYFSKKGAYFSYTRFR